MKKLSILTFLFILSFISKAQDIDSNLVYEKFELNPYRAIIDSTSQDSVWQIGQPQKLNGFSMAYSGVKAIITDTINSYPINHTSCFYFRFDSLPDYWAGWCKDM